MSLEEEITLVNEGDNKYLPDIFDILNEKYNIDSQNSEGITSLMTSVIYGNIYNADFLINKGADLSRAIEFAESNTIESILLVA